MSILSNLTHSAKGKTKIHIEDPNATEIFSQAFAREMINRLKGNNIVIVCIGTDRSTGDCLGPLVGSKLTEMSDSPIDIFGTLDNPVHATNITECIHKIHAKYNDPYIVAIDACLGNLDSIGFVNICKGSLKPGAGVNKSLPSLGDLHITGIVNVGGFLEYFVLQNTRLNIVMKMANIISAGISNGYKNYKALGY